MSYRLNKVTHKKIRRTTAFSGEFKGALAKSVSLQNAEKLLIEKPMS